MQKNSYRDIHIANLSKKQILRYKEIFLELN